jgi:hypothetical protein
MYSLILPVAGKSTRYPNMRPKWLLTHPLGNFMSIEAIRGLDLSRFDNVYWVCLREHLLAYGCEQGIREQMRELDYGGNVVVVTLENQTSSQPETVAAALRDQKISGPICIKDCDNFFRLAPSGTNFVSIADLNSLGLVNASNKSYATTNEYSFVTNIIEKKVISNTFCSGAYGFQDAAEFLEYYQRLSSKPILYLSHIVYSMILDGHAFSALPCSEYIDWGTIEEWDSYKKAFATIFVDLDGTLVNSSSEYFEPRWGTTKGIKENIEALNRLYDSGMVKIIIATSRKEKYREVTVEQLDREGINYHQIIFDLCAGGKRIVVNDYSTTNAYRTCEAINLPRDSSGLSIMLKGIGVKC